MPTAEQIVAIAGERQQRNGRRQAKRREIKETYDGELVLPLPDLDQNEVSAIANMLQQGLDGTSQRAAAMMPDLDYPSRRPGFDNHDELARRRRQANLGWWEANALAELLFKRFRHYFGYATSPVVIRPDNKRGIPKWEIRDPLDTYPSGSDLQPHDCVFCYTQSAAWVKDEYPNSLGFLATAVDMYGRPLPSDTSVSMVEYIDAQEIVLVAYGTSTDKIQNVPSPYPTYISRANGYSYTWIVELERDANLANVPTVVIPGRIALGDPIGQFDALPGMHIKQAKLDALEYNAIVEGVFPTQWLVSHPTSQGRPRIITMADGRQGVLGEIENGTILTPSANPSYLAYQAQDRLERAQRLEGAVPASFGGENPSNVRTGRAADSVLSAQIDHGIAEAQKVMARSLQKENEVAAAVQKAFFGSRSLSFYVSWKGAKGWADYTPSELWDGSEVNIVKYSMPGSDLNGTAIRHGQKFGMGVVSDHWMREHDPEIEDPEEEHRRVLIMQLERALVGGVSTRVNSLEEGGMDPRSVAELIRLIGQEDMAFWSAYIKIDDELKQAQADAAQVPVEQAPGMAAPGQGVDALLGQQQVAPSLEDMTRRLGALRLGQRQTPQERVA